MELKKSYKMRMAVDKLAEKFNFTEDEITYGLESNPENRYREGYYDFAELRCKTTRLYYIVAYDGTVTRM